LARFQGQNDTQGDTKPLAMSRRVRRFKDDSLRKGKIKNGEMKSISGEFRDLNGSLLLKTFEFLHHSRFASFAFARLARIT
jgi:hypothetical protein